MKDPASGAARSNGSFRPSDKRTAEDGSRAREAVALYSRLPEIDAAPEKLNARQPRTAKRCHNKAKDRKTLEPWASVQPDPAWDC
jgi:hypothetical protein